MCALWVISILVHSEPFCLILMPKNFYMTLLVVPVKILPHQELLISWALCLFAIVPFNWFWKGSSTSSAASQDFWNNYLLIFAALAELNLLCSLKLSVLLLRPTHLYRVPISYITHKLSSSIPCKGFSAFECGLDPILVALFCEFAWALTYQRCHCLHL